MAEEEKEVKKGRISRRDFIKGSGIVVGGAAIGSTVLAVACAPAEVEVPGPTQVVEREVEIIKQVAAPGVTTLTVNGRTHTMKVEPEWTLAFVLREKLGLVGLKVGFDRGECGTCNILVDGRTSLACTMLAVESADKNIVTIEGLADGANLHPVQKLFLENSTFQCGYCTPGMIMSAVALLDKTPKPTVDQVKVALSGNLCYCSDYNRQVNTVLKGV